MKDSKLPEFLDVDGVLVRFDIAGDKVSAVIVLTGAPYSLRKALNFGEALTPAEASKRFPSLNLYNKRLITLISTEGKSKEEILKEVMKNYKKYRQFKYN